MSSTRCAVTDKSTQIVDTRRRQLLRLQRRFQAVSLCLFPIVARGSSKLLLQQLRISGVFLKEGRRRRIRGIKLLYYESMHIIHSTRNTDKITGTIYNPNVYHFHRCPKQFSMTLLPADLVSSFPPIALFS